MKQRKAISGILFLLAALLLWAQPALADDVRGAKFAGRFYPADTGELKQQIRGFLKEAEKKTLDTPSGKVLKALIMPHAGYVYSGRTAAHAARTLEPERYEKVIVCGPDHRVGFKNAAVSSVDAYQTPLGTVPLHPDARKIRDQYAIFRSIPASDKREHCIEVILPFLQVRLGRFKLLPVVLGPGNVDRYTEAIDAVYDKETLLVVSSDLSHYLSYEKAKKRDRRTIDMICSLDGKRLASESNRACGATAIRVLTRMARKHNWTPQLIYYENSGDTAGPRRQVVGYAAIAFYGEEAMAESSPMSEEKGQLLVQLARQTIAEKLGQTAGGREDIANRLNDETFQSKRGTFVTLTKNHQLRGCIGNLVPDKPLKEGVQENAVNAAFHDPRFPPLSAGELEQIELEVSLLTEPQPLEYKNADDLLAKLRPKVDGVILRKGMHSATFLPQVWDQLPEKEMFLSHLCMKAGLPGDAWKKGDLEILTYQVQYFEERG